ncbi:hypothetical protein Tco_0243950, partial [Tanacetum coccineum]
YNIRTRKVEENLHVRFLEDKPIIVGDGSGCLTLMFKINDLCASCCSGSLFDSSSKDASYEEPQPSNDTEKKDDEVPTAPLEFTYDDFFGDESFLDLSNIATTYPFPTTPNTRIHKDHSLDHVIGD